MFMHRSYSWSSSPSLSDSSSSFPYFPLDPPPLPPVPSPHCSRCKAAFHYGCYLHLTKDWWCWTTFHMLICLWYIFFGEMSFKWFAHFQIIFPVFSLWFKSDLYILSRSLLSDMRFVRVFSQSVAYLFNFLIRSFEQ